jgi:7-cyano-7-deazaguanine synthase in queuosine biosynthesis
MLDSNCTLRFQPLSDRGSQIFLHSENPESMSPFRLSLNDDAAPYKNASPVAADIIDLASALHVADRVVPTRKENRREIGIELPLRKPEEFSSNRELLQSSLRQCCVDRLRFAFSKRACPDDHFYQDQLPLEKNSYEVALFSGGLDSFAGLLQRARHTPDKNFALVGTGSNREDFGLQENVIKELHRRIGSPRPTLLQTRIHPENMEELPGTRNKRLRLRGMGFMLIGAAHAILLGEERLHVYENGVGALNLPFPGGDPRVDHTQAVHPNTLQKVSDFVSSIQGEPFEIRNPFLFSTKAEMCEALAPLSLSDIIAYTVSCDSRPREDYDCGRVRHCGSCSSCLLRRQALQSSSLRDETLYASEILEGKSYHRKEDHFRAMRSQFNDIEKCLRQLDPWKALVKKYPSSLAYVSFPGNTETAKQKIVDLFRTYVAEWRKHGDGVGTELLKDAQPKSAASSTAPPRP